MRGKRKSKRQKHMVCRITPADAGKTSRGEREIEITPDHPRGCGENHRRALRGTENAGSPPRMRGKHVIIPNLGTANRITPADAGKTCTRKHIARVNGDHPRGCGENSY